MLREQLGVSSVSMQWRTGWGLIGKVCMYGRATADGGGWALGTVHGTTSVITRAAPGEMAFIFHISLQVRRKVTDDTEMRLNYIPSRVWKCVVE